MAQQILINTIPQETRIAILEDDHLVEIHIEGRTNRRLVGDVIKGRVTKVLPGIEAAFVDIGLEKDAFLYVMDVFDNLNEYEKILMGQEEDQGMESEISESGIYAEMIKVPIEDLLREGQEILVQVAKEPIGTKGARVTSHINLPGRHIVFMPTVRHIGVSRRIQNEAERKRLREIVEGLTGLTGGCIVRTVAEGMGAAELESDVEILRGLWKKIQAEAEGVTAPCVVHQDFDPVYRAVRDFFTPEVEKIVVDNEQDYQRCVELVNTINPDYTGRIKLHTKARPLFEEYGVEQALEKAMKRKVWLKSGGYLVIDQTEALVAIDVNTGKYVGRKNLEETITQTNLEAVKEIARQVRLRNLGGIIILDFIDMEKKENRDKVQKALEDAFKSDRARTHIYPFTDLGLIEMTRKRVKRSLGRIMTQNCPYCFGTGNIKSKTAIAADIYRHLQKVIENTESREFLVRVHPDIAFFLRTEDREAFEELELMYKRVITARSDETLHQEQFDIVAL